MPPVIVTENIFQITKNLKSCDEMTNLSREYGNKKGKYIGDPINAIKIFNDKAVDELIFLDKPT